MSPVRMNERTNFMVSRDSPLSNGPVYRTGKMIAFTSALGGRLVYVFQRMSRIQRHKVR